MRVTNQYVVNAFLRQLNRNSNALNNTHIQISSGKQLIRASDNPVNNALAMHNRTEITEHNQYIRNIERTQEWYDNTDSAMSSIGSALQRARELAVQGANDTLVQSDRDAIAMEIDQLIRHMVDIANTDVAGEFLFAGQNVKTKPMQLVDGQSGNRMKDIVTFSLGETRSKLNLANVLDVVYHGNNYRSVTEIEKGVLLEKNITGAELFFNSTPVSPAPNFTNRLPPLNESMQLSVLNGGKGVDRGVILIKDRNGVEHAVDLSRAGRLEDVIHIINSTGSFRAGIEEVPSDAAVSLGIYRNAGPTNLLIGLADPKMLSVNTNLSDLNNGLGVPDGYLSITTRDRRNTRVDISAASTVQDVINSLNGLEGGNLVKAQFNMIHKRLEITDLTGGKGDFLIESMKTQLFIEDLEPRTAAALGIARNAGASNFILSVFDQAIESEATPLAWLNGGKGVERGYITINDKSGNAQVVDLTALTDVQSLIDAINNQTVNINASFDSVSKRIRIQDNTGGAQDFSITEVYGTQAISVRDMTNTVRALGLLKSAQGSTLIGDPLSPSGLTENSLLSTIDPAPIGSTIKLFGGDGTPVEVDLNAASTIRDVVNAINGTGKFKAVWDQNNSRFVISEKHPPTTNSMGIWVQEQTNTASDLGFIQGTSNHQTHIITGAPITIKTLPTLIGGVDLNPAVELSTELAALNSSRTLNKGVNLGYIRITDKAGRFKAIDMRGCVTIQDAINKINDPANGLYVEARINEARNGIEIIDKNNGAPGKLQIIDIDSTTAKDLGITGNTVDTRIIGTDLDPALTISTAISSLRANEGGVPLGKVYIQSGDFSGKIDLTGVKTVGEMLDRLSLTDLRFNIAAWIDSDGKRINISNTKGQPYIKLRDLGPDNQAAASGLGLGATRSIFTTLADLRDNLLRGDAQAISEQSIRDISKDLERVLQLHAEVGVKTNRAQAGKEKLENFTLNLNKMLSLVEDVDMAEAITRMTQLETAFRAALQSGARVMQTTLMEFLR